MAGIRKKTYKNKNGTTTTKYYIIYKDINGKQCSAGGYSTRKEALKHINDYEEHILNENEVTLKIIFSLYRKRLKKCARTTQSSYEMWYRIYFEPIEHLLYKKITPVFLQNLFDNIENDSPYIATICLKMWKAACNYAISKNVIADNKFKRIDKIVLPKAEKQHITVDKIKEMLVVAKKEFSLKYYMMFYLLVGTGMRVGELVALTKSDFNHKECSITINKQYTHGELKYNPKTSSSNRVAYMFKSLADELNNYAKTVEGELLFPSMNNGYIDINNYRRRFWTRLKELTGVPENMRLHDLRGSFIDLVLSSGLSVKFAQNNVGHSKAQTTLDWYAQNNSDMVNAAMERFEEIFQIGWKNGGKFFDNKKSNVLPFRKKSDISNF